MLSSFGLFINIYIVFLVKDKITTGWEVRLKGKENESEIGSHISLMSIQQFSFDTNGPYSRNVGCKMAKKNFILCWTIMEIKKIYINYIFSPKIFQFWWRFHHMDLTSSSNYSSSIQKKWK